MQLDPIVAWSLGELLLVSLIVLLIVAVRGLLARRRDRAAALALVEQIKGDEEQRREETRELLNGRYGIQGEALDETLATLCREEKRFYQTLINLYLGRDAVALRDLNLAFEGAVAPYRELPVAAADTAGDTPVPEQAQEDSVAQADVDAAEVERLRDENQRLSDELRVTMDTMGRMLSEYSSMFSGGDDGELDKEKMIAMFRADAEAELAAAKEADQEPAAGSMGDTETAEADPPSVGDSEAEAVEAAVSSAVEEPVEQAEPVDPGESASAPDEPSGMDQQAGEASMAVDEEALMSLDEELQSLDDELPAEAPAKQAQL